MNELLIIVGLILLNGLFSMSETALISARKSRLSREADAGDGAAKTALRIANDPDCFLSTIQIGITLIGILTGLYSGASFAKAFGSVLIGWGVAPAYALPVAQVLIVVVVTYLSIVVGELVPKRIALSASDRVAKLVARPMWLLSRITIPVVWLLSASTGLVVRLFNIRCDDNKVTESDVKSIIKDGAASGEVKEVEKEIMNRALVMGDLRVASIMTCRKEIVTVDIDMTAAQVKEVLADELHDSYPVLDGDHEDVKGVVSLKDLILKLDDPGFRLADVVVAGTFIPESMTAYDALAKLKEKHEHCLIVCDEFGMMQGVLTLNDILDGLVGTAPESADAQFIIPRADGQGWLVSGQCPLYDFLDYFDCGDLYVPAGYSTVGGLLLELMRKMPEEGESVTWYGFKFEVVDMDMTYIDKILVTKSGNG
ncbi:MAG: hemolysin family protein [Muribaculum sp.]